jgi:hypothetical protein
VQKKLLTQKLTVLDEPRIPLNTTYCKPDLILIKKNVATVIDVQICGEAQMENSFKSKISKYSQPTIQNAIESFIQISNPTLQSVFHVPIILNLRGIMHPKSAAFLKQCGLKFWDISDICTRTIIGSLKTYDVYMRGI